MKFFTKEIKIAITAVIAIVIIYFGITFLKGLKLFSNDTTYYVELKDISGVGVSSNVLANGLKVGYVKAINYDPAKQNLILELSINNEFIIPQGTSIFISKEMLGAAKLNLALSAAENAPLAPGDTIHGNPTTDLMSSIGDMVPTIQNMLPKIDSILTALNALASSPTLPASLENIEKTTANLATASGELNSMMKRDIPKLLSNTNSVMENANTLTTKLNAMDFEGISRNASQAMANVNGITEQINTSLKSKDNTLGMLMNDNSIAVHIDTTVVNASLLLRDLREHPKRYVHFSLFGKKDK